MEVGGFSVVGDQGTSTRFVLANTARSSQNRAVTSQQNDSKPKVAAWTWGLNGFLVPTRTHTHFAYHKKLNDYYVQVIDDKTNKVIQEIPPKEFLDRYAAMAEKFGIIIDEHI